MFTITGLDSRINPTIARSCCSDSVDPREPLPHVATLWIESILRESNISQLFCRKIREWQTKTVSDAFLFCLSERCTQRSQEIAPILVPTFRVNLVWLLFSFPPPSLKARQELISLRLGLKVSAASQVLSSAFTSIHKSPGTCGLSFITGTQLTDRQTDRQTDKSIRCRFTALVRCGGHLRVCRTPRVRRVETPPHPPNHRNPLIKKSRMVEVSSFLFVKCATSSTFLFAFSF